MDGLKTAHGQLALVSEFRFDYWRASGQHEFYTVKRGRRALSDKWAVLDGGEHGSCWNGAQWCFWRGAAMFCYELEEALVVARQLAFEENQRIIGRMETHYPGEFRGGVHDLAVEKSPLTGK